MKQTVKLNENELKEIISDTFRNYINNIRESQDLSIIDDEEIDEDVDEGFGDNLTQGVKSFFGRGDFGKDKGHDRANGGLNLKQRWNAAKTNYKMKGEYDKYNEVINFITDLINNGKINPDMPIGQLVHAGKYSNSNLGGSLIAQRDNRASRGSKAQNDIYRK